MKVWKGGAIYGVAWWILSLVLFYFGGLWRREDIISTFLSYTAALPFKLAANIYEIYYLEDAGIIATILSLPLSFILAFLIISIHGNIKTRNIKRLAIPLIIVVIISGSFLAISPINAKYRDIRSGLFDIPLNAKVSLHSGFIPSSNPKELEWGETGINYKYKSNGYEYLYVTVPGRMSYPDAKIALLKYVENKNISDEISKIPIDKELLMEFVSYDLRGPGGCSGIGTLIGMRAECYGNYIDESGELHLLEGVEVISSSYRNDTKYNVEFNLNATHKGKKVTFLAQKFGDNKRLVLSAK